jgi:hypothetical protein
VVHVIRLLLAGGAAGINRVPVRLALPVAISNRRSRGTWRAGPRSRINNAAAATVKRAFSDRENLIIRAFRRV